VSALIVYESCFGNTGIVAEQVAEGLRGAGVADVRLVLAHEAPETVPDGVTLVVVGAPTHNWGLPGEQTRGQAAQQGAGDASAAGTGLPSGVKEWIERVAPSGVACVTFDTSVKSWFAPSTAAKAAAKALTRRGFRGAARGTSFYVTDTKGPLKDGEVDRARQWGAELATRA